MRDSHSSSFAVLLLALILAVHCAANAIDSCQVTLEGHVLTVSNRVTTHEYSWNKGAIALTSVRSGELSFDRTGNESPLFQISEDGMSPVGARLETKVGRNSILDTPYLEAVIQYDHAEIKVRHLIRVYPDSPLISHAYELSGELERESDEANTDSLQMIESSTLKELSWSRLARVPLGSHRFSLTVARFEEATDHHDNLLQEDRFLAYRKPVFASGNVAIVRGNDSDYSILALKESPLGESQQHYPGHDFVFTNQGLDVVGLGLTGKNIDPKSWSRSYAIAFGISRNDRLSELMALRKHQKQIRDLLPERDEMILANTWGDRSRDSRMNEQFILKEIERAAEMGVTHLQLDDGWQKGLSRNSASKAGEKWDSWQREDWEIHPERFPNGFSEIVSRASSRGIKICLWFNPSKAGEYANWERDADILIDYYRKWGISTFKIDGIDLTSKEAEVNLGRMFRKVLYSTDGYAVFNFDVTAGHRFGYHCFTEYGNIFLENRYTDWANYYPYRTLRNLWMLSKYVPAETLQIEFLNKWRNADRYAAGDLDAPFEIGFDYLFAITLMAQPLAWMEVSQLPAEAEAIFPLVRKYKEIQHEIHQGTILPIGMEPSGTSWTGFQSVQEDQKQGYILVFRERNEQPTKAMSSFLPAGQLVVLERVLGGGKSFEALVGPHGEVEFTLAAPNSFCLYRYVLTDEQD